VSSVCRTLQRSTPLSPAELLGKIFSAVEEFSRGPRTARRHGGALFYYPASDVADACLHGHVESRAKLSGIRLTVVRFPVTTYDTDIHSGESFDEEQSPYALGLAVLLSFLLAISGGHFGNAAKGRPTRGEVSRLSPQ